MGQQGLTLLSWVVRQEDEAYEAFVQLLVNFSADVGCKDEDGMPALCVAAKNGYYNVVQTLIGGGAALEAKDDAEGRTALLWAIEFFRYDVIELLINNGADTAATDNEGCTAQDWARWTRDATIITLVSRPA